MGKFISFIFKLLFAVVFLFGMACLTIAVEGSLDQGQHADLGLVIGDATTPHPKADPILDRAVKEFNAGTFLRLVVVAPDVPRDNREAGQTGAMVKYLVAHGVPSNVIIEEKGGEEPDRLGRSVAGIMRDNDFDSVIIVADYYRIPGIQMALVQAGERHIGKAHVGDIQKEDVPEIVGETVQDCQFLARNYLIPTAQKIGVEAETGLAKIKDAGVVAKEKANKGVDSMSK